MTVAHELEALGLTGEVYQQGREMKILCPFHDDTRPSMSVNVESGVWICYAGCGQGNWVELFSYLTHKTDGKYKAEVPTANGALPADGSNAPILRSFLERGFTRPMLAKWGVSWDQQAGAMRLPVYDDNRAVIGNIWRMPNGVSPPYQYEPGMPKSEMLYGMWRLTGPLHTISLVEGPLDAIWSQEAGISTVAILGASISNEQVAMLKRRGLHQVVLAFDNDEAGGRATHRAATMLRGEGFWTLRIRMPLKYKDIQEVPLDQVAGLFEHPELCVNGSGMIHPRFARWSNGHGG